MNFKDQHRQQKNCQEKQRFAFNLCENRCTNKKAFNSQSQNSTFSQKSDKNREKFKQIVKTFIISNQM